MAEYKLELRGVCKSFPGVKALDNVQLSLRPGTVHALMGENGAGKSTLMKCLFGIYKMDAGEIILDGEKVEINNPDEAMKKGIAMVHQELQPVPARSVAENMYLGRFPTKCGPLKVIDHKKMYEDTDEIDKESCKPNATILCYPVIDMFEYRHDGSRQNLIGERALHSNKELMSLYKHVTPNTPPTFIWHTSSDQAVPVENSLMYADSLSKMQVSYEMHIYPIGSHGLGLADSIPHVAQWKDSLEKWIKLNDLI